MGTFRAMDEEWRFKAHELIRKQATNWRMAWAQKSTCISTLDILLCTTMNNLITVARKLAESFHGNEKVETTELRMGAEDFGYYSQVIPGCFFRLGVGNEKKGIISGVHTPTFNIDESAIEIGAGMMAWLGASAEFK